jgi:UDP-N-acetyl-2-amino-2-deoxyglucuronate dehydrogenase
MHLGILGAGNISATHLRAAQSVVGVEVAAVLGTTMEKAGRLAFAAGAAAYDDLDRFLSHRPMAAVAIGAPSGLHAELATAAAERGLHVLVEKPLDISASRIDDLIAVAERNHVRIGVFFQDRLKPDIVRAKTMIEDGRLGAPVLVSGRVKWHRPADYYAASRWRGTHALDGGGALMNQGIHTVDLMQWMCGAVASVSARAATRVHRIEAEDTAAAVLEFESGALGVIEAATSVYPGYPRRIEVTGTNGTLVIEQDSLVAVDLRDGHESIERAAPAESASSAAVSDASAHARIIRDFVRSIETGTPLACDAREGRKSVAIVEAMYESARTGQTVRPR